MLCCSVISFRESGIKLLYGCSEAEVQLVLGLSSSYHTEYGHALAESPLLLNIKKKVVQDDHSGPDSPVSPYSFK